MSARVRHSNRLVRMIVLWNLPQSRADGVVAVQVSRCIGHLDEMPMLNRLGRSARTEVEAAMMTPTCSPFGRNPISAFAGRASEFAVVNTWFVADDSNPTSIPWRGPAESCSTLWVYGASKPAPICAQLQTHEYCLLRHSGSLCCISQSLGLSRLEFPALKGSGLLPAALIPLWADASPNRKSTILGCESDVRSRSRAHVRVESLHGAQQTAGVPKPSS